jgi:hypothetical protein
VRNAAAGGAPRGARSGADEMSRFGRANRTGRSSGILSKHESRLVGPPQDGESWAFIPRALLDSAAWRGLSIHCRRFIDFLMIEHCNHAGQENGRLQATYDQLTRNGISRKRIRGAIKEAVERGLVEVTLKGGLYGIENCKTPSRYRLTWIGTLNPESHRTNEWKNYEPAKKNPQPNVGTAHTFQKWKRPA